MSLRLNSEAPNFTAETTEGTIDFHEWIGDGWAVLFSHPKDFTPICTTELGYAAKLKPDFEKRNCKIIGLSVDPVSDHVEWAKDIESSQGHAVNYPMIGDEDLKVAKLYDMLPADAGDSAEGRTAVDNLTARTVFIIGPDKKISPWSAISCSALVRMERRCVGELKAALRRSMTSSSPIPPPSTATSAATAASHFSCSSATSS